MIKIELQKTYEEFEVGGNVYRMDLHDDKVVYYLKSIRKFEVAHANIIEKQNQDPENLEEVVEESKVLCKDAIELFLGAGTFDQIYLDVGKSLYNLLILLDAIKEVIEKNHGEVKKKTIEKYKR